MEQLNPLAHSDIRMQLSNNSLRLFQLSQIADEGRAHPGDADEALKLMISIGFAASKLCTQVAQASAKAPQEPWRMTDEEIFKLPKVNDEDQKVGD